MNELNKSPEPTKNFTVGVKEALEVPLKDRVKVLLLRIGRSQNWLSEQCGVSHGCMSQIVNGLWTPSSRIMLLMADMLDVDSVVLFGDTEYWKQYNDRIGYPKEEKE